MSRKLNISYFILVAIVAQTITTSATIKLCLDNREFKVRTPNINSTICIGRDAIISLSRTLAFQKCLAFEDALRTEKTGIELECVECYNCMNAVSKGAADAVIVNSDEHPGARQQLEAILYESYDDNNLIVALIDADKENEIQDLPLAYEKKGDLRLIHSAMYINHHRSGGVCSKAVRKDEGSRIELERYHEIKKAEKKKLVCIENGQLVTKPISEYKNCHVESNIPNAVMVKIGATKRNEIAEAFLTATQKLGHGRNFQLFGPFKGENDLIFSDETKALVAQHSEPNGVDVDKFLKLHCDDIINHEHAEDSHGHGHDHDHDHDHHHHHHH